MVLGWLWKIDRLRRHANDRSDWRLGKWWDYLIRICIPIILCALFMWSLFGDFTKEGGFLRDPAGKWILTNCVGMSIMILVPLVGVVISFAKGRSRGAWQDEPSTSLQIKGRTGSAIALVLAVASAVLVVILFKLAMLGRAEKNLLWLSLPPAVIAVIVSNYLLEKGNGSTTRASWFARWAGMLATLDIGGFIALYLIYSTRRGELAKPVLPLPDQLNAVSYLILSVVFLLILGGEDGIKTITL